MLGDMRVVCCFERMDTKPEHQTLHLTSHYFPSPSPRLLQECHLEDYDPSLAVIADFSTIVIQYGYVTLFVAACPVVSVCMAA